MNTELTGILAWVFNICVLVTSIAIILTGTWCILNFVVWEVLLRWALNFLKLYKVFVHFIMYRKRYFEWAKKYEGKIEEGSND
jgi:hypothetical protein